ncbi:MULTISPECIES: dihydrofolate reductase [unclassified Aeromicrobium]|uniref:dihydrofolate reductase n=1 Tax=unclassified Aeromicrobium TaxID=2633570 RepID=UPI00396AF8F6
MTVTVAVAVGENGVIGFEGGMPWPRTGDMRQFKELTWGHPIVMGRATYESIGRPLPGRTSIVLTRRAGWDPGDPGLIVAGDLDAALTRARELDDQVFLIGGAAVFDEALERDLVDTMVVTHVPLSPPGDTFFAPIDPDRWTEVERVAHAGTPDYEIATYVRR